VEEQARAFYGELLGLQEIEKPDALKSKGGVWFSVGVGELHVGLEEQFTPARKAHPAFLVNDLPALRARLELAGIPTSEAEPIPGNQRFYVHDPFGNRIELLEKQDQV
jgi:catechol 2,3-dioxygenase-like lactoylglutathione lyase family enzyme